MGKRLDIHHFRQIGLPFRRKAEILIAIVKFASLQPEPVPRGKSFFQQFIREAAPLNLLKLKAGEPWLEENVARLFWTCCELGLFRYQYPYPHRGQTYALTRGGRVLARLPSWAGKVFVAIACAVARVSDPIKTFNRIRNVVTIATAVLLWWRKGELSAFVITISILAGVVSTWIASFFTHE
jgi:hypothetical protein